MSLVTVTRTQIPDEVQEALLWAWRSHGWCLSEGHRRVVLDYIDTLLELVPRNQGDDNSLDQTN